MNYTVSRKIMMGMIILCLTSGIAACGTSQADQTRDQENAVESEADPKVIEEEPEEKEPEEASAETVKEVQDVEYETLIAGNLTKNEMQFVLAYGPDEIPEQGFQNQDYLFILNTLCQASEHKVSEPIIETYGTDANWGCQYSLSDVNRIFRSFTDYQLTEENNILSENNVHVQGDVVSFAAATISKTSNAVITSASYTEEEMEIYYTYDYITFDMESKGLPKQTENRKVTLKPNADGLYQITAIEVTEEQAEGEQMPEEQTAGQPAENTGIHVGSYSYAASAGGFRGTLDIESESMATYMTFGSASGEGEVIRYQIIPDDTVTVPAGVTAYTFQFIEGNTIQLRDWIEYDVTGVMESGYNLNFNYDANQGILQDSYGNKWDRVN